MRPSLPAILTLSLARIGFSYLGRVQNGWGVWVMRHEPRVERFGRQGEILD